MSANDHVKYADWLPLYVSGALGATERRSVEGHLARCSQCQSDLALWRMVGSQVAEENRDLAAPPALVEHAIAQVHGHRANVFQRALELIRAQVPLVRGEMWFASAAVMALGVIVATIVHNVGVLQQAGMKEEDL